LPDARDAVLGQECKFCLRQDGRTKILAIFDPTIQTAVFTMK
jgi:hypothetical protein